MTDLLSSIGNNNLASTLIAAVVLAAFGGVWNWYRNRQDSKKIYDFLLGSLNESNYTFRSTEAIVSHTKISESRVAELCSKHPKIRRNAKEKQSWQIIV